MKTRAYLLALLLVCVGSAVIVRGGGTSAIRTKAWLVENTPKSVGKFETQPGPDGSSETYPMDIPNLKASGIVCRIMTDGTKSIDVVVVNSSRGESFHDPATCFTGQGWDIVRQEQRTVATKSLGMIPVNNLVIRRKDTNVEQVALYCFRHKMNVYGLQSELLRELLFGELTTAKSQEGNMYRFIALDPRITEAELHAFVGEYMDLAIQAAQE
jgi:hypothetical protein